MEDQESLDKVECPHCRWTRDLSISTYDNGRTITVRGFLGGLKDAIERIKEARFSSQLERANAWVDMPPCPRCHNVYCYNVCTGETRK